MIESLDSLLQTLRNTKAQCEAGEVPVSQIMQLPSAVEKCKKDVDDRHKEIYSSLARFGKTLDKVGMGTLCPVCGCINVAYRNSRIRSLHIPTCLVQRTL